MKVFQIGDKLRVAKFMRSSFRFEHPKLIHFWKFRIAYQKSWTEFDNKRNFTFTGKRYF